MILKIDRKLQVFFLTELQAHVWVKQYKKQNLLGHLDGIKSTLTVRENLEFWASVFGTGSIDAAIAVFDMDQLIDRPGGMLSAGQKRRLGLARLMVTGRPIWLLDEPTVSLDTVAVGQFGDMIAGHLDRGGIAVIATHIDLGLGARAETLDLSHFKAAPEQQFNPNEAFL